MLKYLTGCSLSAKNTMRATVLRPGTSTPNPENQESGYWDESARHPITNEIIRVWVPEETEIEDNPDTKHDEGWFTFPCEARSVVTGGLNTQGTAERWTTKGEYEDVDFVTIKYSPKIILTKRDRITNIRGADGEILWVEEGMKDPEGKHTYKPTIFDVNGVSPLVDPFNNHIENYALLSRATSQNPETVA